jgi:DNA invertase Pin-like site-specific DNA recombinase
MPTSGRDTIMGTPAADTIDGLGGRASARSLARSQLQLLQIAEEVEAKRAELVSVMDRVDTSTATGKMLFGILGVLAEFERNLIIERSRAGQAVARRNGKVFGRPAQADPFARPASEAGA